MIAFLQDKGRTLILELTPLPGKPGYFDAKVVTLTEGAKPKTPRMVPKNKARPHTTDGAKTLGEWLKENPGTHPLYSTVQKVLKITSAGTAQNVVREAARLRMAKFDVKNRPHTVSGVS
jgi:hypothetical protein